MAIYVQTGARLLPASGAGTPDVQCFGADAGFGGVHVWSSHLHVRCLPTCELMCVDVVSTPTCEVVCSMHLHVCMCRTNTYMCAGVFNAPTCEVM